MSSIDAQSREIALAWPTLMHALPLDFIEIAADVGFDAVGLRVARSPDMPIHPVAGNAPLIREMKRRLRAANLKVLDVLAFYIGPKPDFDLFARALEATAEFDCHYALTVGHDHEWARLRDNFGRFCDCAAGFNVTAALEFVPCWPLSTLAQAKRLLAETKQKNVAICVDPIHLARSGEHAADLVGMDPALFPYAQFDDGILEPGEPDSSRFGQESYGPGKRAFPGEGELRLGELLDVLPAGIPLSVEIFMSDISKMTSREWAGKALASTKRFLAEHRASGPAMRGAS